MKISRLVLSVLSVIVTLSMVSNAWAQWRVLPPRNEKTNPPERIGDDAQPIKLGDTLRDNNQFHWIIGDLEIPAEIEGKSTAGQPVGMRINGADGGEVWLDGKLQSRFDNDHPALILVSPKAKPGTRVRIAIQIYGQVQGGDKFDEASWTLIDKPRANGRLALKVQADKAMGDVPDGLIGLSQGGGLADYEDATAAKLREAGFKWFRMDNILTNALKKDDQGKLVYDWTDFDRRADFIVKKLGAEPIFAVSYMPQVLDAVENHDRQSAPRDYGIWEDLCYEAAKRAIERGARVPWWEVWNEANSGWIKPGPEDVGGPEIRALYEKAVGKTNVDHEIIRRFEAYAKLYRATVRGVKRADPKAYVGGPALASGPFEQEKYGHCVNGKGFARGLMAWCKQENLPLDFVSWHEYFQPSDIIAGQADAFREYLADYPPLDKTVRSYMITEWNEAWWTNRPMDHEIGAAWCGDCVVRAFIPHKIDRPCFFYVKQNDTNFRGDFSMLMQNNVPKASYNMAKIFNNLSGQYVKVDGGDGEVCAVATWDAGKKRLAIVLVNFNYRYNLQRHVEVAVDKLPVELRGGQYREWVIDATHSNVWNNKDHAELEQAASGAIEGKSFKIGRTLGANSITLIELVAGDK